MVRCGEFWGVLSAMNDRWSVVCIRAIRGNELNGGRLVPSSAAILKNWSLLDTSGLVVPGVELTTACKTGISSVSLTRNE